MAIDTKSPAHEVYKCVAVNGSIYTWEFLSAGMSVLSSKITGEGGESMDFPYSTLLTPYDYVVKRGDLIIDSEGYLYQITGIDSTYCRATYCGTHLGGIASGDKDYSLVVTEDNSHLQLVTESGNIISDIDYMHPDNINATLGNLKALINLQSDYVKDVRHTISGTGMSQGTPDVNDLYSCPIIIEVSIPSVGTIESPIVESYTGLSASPSVNVENNIITISGYANKAMAKCSATVSYKIAPKIID